MFSENVKNGPGATAQAAPVRRRRGRPRGATEQGIAAKRRLYQTAIGLIASRGFEATTLRDIAEKADVSVGLLYRYFPSKRAVVLALYDDLSARYAARAADMGPGPWRERFLFALRTSLEVLAPHRGALAALTPVLVGDAHEGLFAPATAFSRRRVQAVFQAAVQGASDAPPPDDVEALGQLLYVIHLAIILWWLLDKSAGQTATAQLIAILARALPIASLSLRLDPARAFVRAASGLCRDGLFGDRVEPASTEGRP